jgi:hypothetical protein
MGGNGLRRKDAARHGICCHHRTLLHSRIKLRGCSGEEFNLALVASETARDECVIARLAVEEHKKEHGC